MTQIRSVMALLVVLALVGLQKPASATPGLIEAARDPVVVLATIQSARSELMERFRVMPAAFWELKPDAIWPARTLAEIPGEPFNRVTLVIEAAALSTALQIDPSVPLLERVDVQRAQLAVFVRDCSANGRYSQQAQSLLVESIAMANAESQSAQESVPPTPSVAPVAVVPTAPVSVVMSVPPTPLPVMQPHPVTTTTAGATNAAIELAQRERVRANQLEQENRRLRAALKAQVVPNRVSVVPPIVPAQIVRPSPVLPKEQTAAKPTQSAATSNWFFWAVGFVGLLVIALCIIASSAAISEHSEQNKRLIGELGQINKDRYEQAAELRKQQTNTIDEIRQLRLLLADQITQAYGIWWAQGFLNSLPSLTSDLRADQLLQLFADLQRTILATVNERVERDTNAHRHEMDELQASMDQLRQSNQRLSNWIRELKPAELFLVPIIKLQKDNQLLLDALQVLTTAAAQGGRLDDSATTAALAPLADLEVDGVLLVSRLAGFRRKRQSRQEEGGNG